MKKHPEIGYKILKPMKFLSGIVNMVYQHHERWDGKGYPQGLKGEEIDFLASIVAVADSYDAMTSQRGYNKVMPVDEVMDEFAKCSGTKYNPIVVEAFLAVLEDMKLRESVRSN